MHHFQAIIFDMDGLILDTERVALCTFEQACLKFGLDPAQHRSVFIRCLGTNATAGKHILDQGLRDHVDPEAFGVTWDEIYFHETQQKPVPIKPGADALFTHIRSLGIPMAVATSSRTARAEKTLNTTGIRHFFKHVVGGDQVVNSKPHPDIYIKAAEQLNADPAGCLAFEDSENGVRAAHASGMTVVQIPDLVPPSQALLDLGHIVLNQLSDAIDHPFNPT